MFTRFRWLSVAAFLIGAIAAQASEQVLDARLHHLRAGAEREWDEFPAQAEGPRLLLRFPSDKNADAWTLRLRQQDVKQIWKVTLNGKDLGTLRSDENDMVIYLPVPPATLTAGENLLKVESTSRAADDIRVGDIVLDERLLAAVLSEATVDLTVTETDRPLPCRITVLNAQGALHTTGAVSGGHLAVRPGVIYSGDGRARFGLPAGEYTIYAGRGFEYSITSCSFSLKCGEVVNKRLSIRREVPTPGYVCCDTHVHTLTHSGHGDATVDERVLTLAGEGVELPVACEHNLQVDYHPAAVKRGVRQYFTPLVGNEVTTPVGHFNIFPVQPGGPIPGYQFKTWQPLFASIDRQTAAKAIILNHPRDLHSGYRPFGPEHHNAVTGENLDGWELRAGAMELVNSGALQSDVMRTYRDWFGLLNRGRFLTPVGASDSHDVSRYIVGQGRTYIRCPDDDPGQIDVQQAVASFRAGRVLVSLGLLAEITVNDKYGPGDLVPAAGEVKVAVRVLGPGWVTADKVELYANGHRFRAATITNGAQPGVKWSGEWRLPPFKHDVHLVAIVTGPGVSNLYWPVAKPYQPTSPQVRRWVIGSSGAVWIDADSDGKRTSAYDYAQQLRKAAGEDVIPLVKRLAGYDEAVAAQAAGLLQAQGVSIQDATVRDAAKRAGGHVERGFQAFFEAWRESQIARRRMANEPPG